MQICTLWIKLVPAQRSRTVYYFKTMQEYFYNLKNGTVNHAFDIVGISAHSVLLCFHNLRFLAWDIQSFCLWFIQGHPLL